MTPVGSIEISYLFIFYIKFDPTRKARLVADEHRHKDIPYYLTYSLVVLRENLRISFLLGALNVLDTMVCDTGKAYINATNREKST